MTDLQSLLERVKAAQGPDQWLGFAIMAATNPHKSGPYASWDAAAHAFGWDDRITYSLDAALALVERCLPGVWWVAGKGRRRAAEPLYGATLLFGEDEALGAGEHEHSPALALLSALLTALIQKGEPESP